MCTITSLSLQAFVSCAQFLIVPKDKMMDKVSCAKRQRKVMMLRGKIELLNCLAQGESAASVGHHDRISDSTVRCIRKSESNIHSSVAASAPQSAKVSFQSHNPCVERMVKD